MNYKDTQQILNNWNANDKHDNSKSNNLHHEKTGSFKNTLSSKEITKIKISSCNNNEIDQSNNKDQMQSKKESAMFFKNDNNTIPSMFDLKLEHDDENSRKKSMISNKSKDSKDSREKILKTKSYIPIFYNNLLEKSQKNTKTDLHNILNTKNEFNSKKDLKVKIYKEFKKDIIRPQKSLSDNKINRMDSACFEINKSSKAILNKAKYQSTLNIKHPNKTEIKRSSKMTLYDNIIESPKTVTKLENKNDNNVEQGKKLLNLFNATMPLEKEFLQQIPITKNSIKSSSNNKSSFSDNSNSNNKNKNKNKRKHSSLKKLKLPNKFAKKSRHSSGINNENSINFTSEVKLSNSLNTIEVNLHMRLTETMKTHKLNNPILLGFSSNLTEESFGVNDEEMHYINLCSNAFCILDDNKIDYKRVNSLSYKLNCFNKKELVNKIRYPFVLNGNVFLERVDFFRNFEGKTKIFPMNSSQLSDYQVKIKDDENFSCNKFISRKINDDFSFEYLKLTKSPDVFPVFLVNYIEPNENIPVFQLNEINYTIFSEALESIESLNYETIVVCLVKKSSHNVISFLIKFIIQHYFIK